MFSPYTPLGRSTNDKHVPTSQVAFIVKIEELSIECLEEEMLEDPLRVESDTSGNMRICAVEDHRSFESGGDDEGISCSFKTHGILFGMPSLCI